MTSVSLRNVMFGDTVRESEAPEHHNEPSHAETPRSVASRSPRSASFADNHGSSGWGGASSTSGRSRGENVYIQARDAEIRLLARRERWESYAPSDVKLGSLQLLSLFLRLSLLVACVCGSQVLLLVITALVVALPQKIYRVAVQMIGIRQGEEIDEQPTKDGTSEDLNAGEPAPTSNPMDSPPEGGVAHTAAGVSTHAALRGSDV